MPSPLLPHPASRCVPRVPTALVLVFGIACPSLACGDGSREDNDTDGEGNDVGDAIVPDGAGSDDDVSGDGESSDCPEGGCLDLGGTLTTESSDDCNDGSTYGFNVIWIANTSEGTVSKIDTDTAQELARYRTGPNGDENPSRTSVNLRGDVAVGNRRGSVIKIIEKLENCVDKNGDGVRTSTGPADVLPWGEDDCVAWTHEVGFSGTTDPYTGGPRAIAWDFDREASDPDISGDCYGNPNVWVGWLDPPSTTTILRRLEGSTGQVDVDLHIENWAGNWGHGSYGGAIDSKGDFWALGTKGTLVHVDGDLLEVSRWDHPTGSIRPYGLAIDAADTPWMAGYDGHIYRFDRTDGLFIDLGAITGGPSILRGLAIDKQGHAWLAGNAPCGLVRYDTHTETVVDALVPLPGCTHIVGVSIDNDSQVWAVDRYANQAYELEPSDYSTRVVTGLVDPYTYSDMTGQGLNLVVPPTE
ncbi:MAG: hypothetical protein V3V08_18595 [Nannocystaceae bacterium]